MTQMRNLREGGGYAAAMEECCQLVDLDQTMDDLSELDGALLMELMEDLPPSDDLVDDGDADRLSHVIRSLEAEIMDDGEAAAAMVVDDHDGRRLEDMLSDLEFAYCWPEVPLEGHELDGWCMYMDGHERVELQSHEHETVDHQCYYADSPVEQVYIPLWE